MLLPPKQALVFAARCLYSAARVLVQNIKKLHGDARIFESLHCLLSVMSAYKASNPLAELYVNQLSQDFEGNVQDPTFMPSRN